MSDIDTEEMTKTDEVFQIQEIITVPDKDLSPGEMAKIMKQVSRVCNFLGSLVMKSAAISNDPRVAGAGHPICQHILNCAVQADSAAMQLAPPPQIMQAADRIPVPVVPMSQRRH
jgi:hypothetical protein